MNKLSNIIVSLVTLVVCCLNSKTALACSADQILSRDPEDLSKARCITLPKAPFITLQYPFKQQHATYCSQGNGNLSGSHSHDNILFAIDFLTPPNQHAGEIYAAHDGIVYVYNECKFRKTLYRYSHLDDCGNGYGNHVRILHPNGYLTVYAHLSRIVAKHKSQVKAGDKIGIEGMSGNAGKRHLHFALHKPENLDLIETEPGYTGRSVPFIMKFAINDKEQILVSTKIPCNNGLGAALLRGAK